MARIAALFFFSLLISVGRTQTVAQGEVKTLFLLGDGGEPYVKDTPIGKVLSQRIASAGEGSMVLFLGDNVYPAGLPDTRSRKYPTAETALRTQVGFIEGFDTRAVFIPGNHDWQHWGRKGLQYIKNQQRWLDSLNDTRVTLLPRNGCPGPIVVPLNEDNLLVILDTQWFLHQWEKPHDSDLCGPTSTAEVLLMVEDIFRSNPTKRIILAAHHPLITYGEHGGVFPWKTHVFPLTDLSDHLYVPMPVVGSIYPLFRKWFGHLQDTPHPVYREFGSALRKIMAEHPGSLYVAGHEHALQYIVRDSTHFIVSGSAAKTEWVKKKKYAVFAQDVKGFAQVDLNDNGTVFFSFIRVDEQFPEGRVIFSESLPSISRAMTEEESGVNFEGQTVEVSASEQYRAGEVKKWLLGDNYRSAWAQKLRVPVFDIGAELGGLKILQKGGGQQTLSLRLSDSTGREYMLRSVEKYPEAAIPEVLRGTFAQDLVQDQISAAHPYAALVVAPMADAVGLYHTNPRLVYIPDDPRLGEYRSTFANTLAIFEERPDEDWSHAPWFGNSENIIGTQRVLEKLADDNDNSVDQEFVLRNRLFDLIIGDWDRHDDQWRWATTEVKKKEIYRPIPRDRDQAFFVNEGVLPKVWSRKWALPKFEGFDEEIDWPAGLSFNARHFDRTFLNGLSRNQWIAIAEDLKSDLTDSIIEAFVRQWPEELFKLHGSEVIRKLKSRRDRIVSDALAYYEFLAREVDIVGSDKMEAFDVERLSSGDVHVVVRKISKKGVLEQKLFDRVFSEKETKEIRLFGLGGGDRFSITGTARSSILLRVIGGEGEDILSDSSRVRSLQKKTVFYDTPGDGTFYSAGEVSDRRSTDAEVNEYDRTSFEYGRLAPLIWGHYNPDDGLFVGAGFLSLRHGFRKDPFSQRHLFLASIAPATQSYNFRYRGKYTDVLGRWDVEADADFKAPNYVNNFFGMGNESVFNDDIDDEPGIDVDEEIHYYRYRFNEVSLYPSVSRELGHVKIQFGPLYQRIKLERPREGQDRFIEEYANTLPFDIFQEARTFGGMAWFVTAGLPESEWLPQRGVRLSVQGRNMASLDKGEDFSSYEGSLSFYYSAREHSRLVIATRVGGGFNTGTYPFYQAQVLDGKASLRGFRKTRFYGDSKMYGNVEARLRLTRFRSYLFPASLGILGFFDVGRIWYKNEDSDRWHKGFGGGLWFTPFNLTVLSLEAGHSREGTLGYVRLGFLF